MVITGARVQNCAGQRYDFRGIRPAHELPAYHSVQRREEARVPCLGRHSEHGAQEEGAGMGGQRGHQAAGFFLPHWVRFAVVAGGPATGVAVLPGPL